MLVGGGLALSASVGWFLHRHDEWMWLLQVRLMASEWHLNGV
jgi:hypothetical protein